MKQIGKILVITVGMLFAQLAKAIDCVALAPLLRDQTTIETDQETFKSLLLNLSEDESQSFEEFKQNALALGISVPIVEELVPVELSGEFRNESATWQSYKRKLRQHIEKTDYSHFVSSRQFSSFKTEALNVISECINKPGLTMWADYSQDSPDLVNIYFKYNGDPTARVTSVLRVLPEKSWGCSHNFIQKGLTIGSNVRSETCTRLADTDASISLLTEHASAAVSLPKKGDCQKRDEYRTSACPTEQSGYVVEIRQFCPSGLRVFTDWHKTTSYCSTENCKSSTAIVRQIYKNLLGRPSTQKEEQIGKVIVEQSSDLRQLVLLVAATSEFTDRSFLVNSDMSVNSRFVNSPNVYKSFLREFANSIAGKELPISQVDPDSLIVRLQGCPGCRLEPALHRDWIMYLMAKDLLFSSYYANRFGSRTIPVSETPDDDSISYCPRVSECLDDESSCR